ncbi:MAG TPA: S8 family serine peptidase, partial [Armatimonadota bacterium]|nr:S8 family serine peptidase [Armatimonadota bacterium]
MIYNWISSGMLALGATTLAAAGMHAGDPRKAPLPVPAFAVSKLAPNLRGLVSQAPRKSYIVRLRRPLQGLAAVRSAGSSVIRSYSALPLAAVTATPDQLNRLLISPEVTHVSSNAGVARTNENIRPAVGADIAQRPDFTGWTGQSVGIAIIDSGIDDRHNDLKRSHTNLRDSRVVVTRDFIGGTEATATKDPCGHGTHVAGCAAGDGYESIVLNGQRTSTRSYVGIAPGANLLNLRVLNKAGQGTVDGTLAAINWCIENKSLYNIGVINLSLSHLVHESYTEDPLCLAVEKAWKAGIVVVCAAGNRGRSVADDPDSPTAYGTVGSPGNSPFVITVGATKGQATRTRGDDTVASYSSRGPTRVDKIVKPDLVAPGNKVISLRHPGSSLEKVAGRTNLINPDTYMA